MKHTMKTISKQLESFRHIIGHHIHVHSSLKAVGEVEGRGEALLAGLIDFFTQDGGMISFPTHTWDTTLIDKGGNVFVKPLHYIFEEYGDISRHFGKLEKAFRYHNCIVDGTIGNAKVQLCSTRKMREVLELIHKRSNYVEIFLDDKPLPEEWYMV